MRRADTTLHRVASISSSQPLKVLSIDPVEAERIELILDDLDELPRSMAAPKNFWFVSRNPRTVIFLPCSSVIKTEGSDF